ncbi:DNA glycosylase AlkZ-like family protein [Ornithinimicrobium pratense]|uniref:Winged helix-turn-helix domain-containing protein n=1 Tax=Ornithinimicrobium pratense TaxID=2593973 RepID=A0A5J6V7B2_9MICO|nr:crosslink repair DNA glycosylase YcaQ family protein [Ornithinimicrobium pratense]QFG69011.1 winged helix-turn-helix domain-containing protein [Ornithinimicrobium pratense]
MQQPHRLTARDARRVAVRAQLLSRPRPGDVVEAVRELAHLQIDPVNAVAPAQHLVLWSRLGSDYDTGELTRLLADRTLVELHGHIRPAEDIALYATAMAGWPVTLPGREGLLGWQRHNAEWVAGNDRARRDVLAHLQAEGPTPTGGLPDTTEVPWRSSGWTHEKNLGRLLDFMVARGEVAVASREGGQRLWDLAERVYPGVPALPLEEAIAEQDRRRLAACGILRPRGPQCPTESLDGGEAGEEAVVEGLPGTWRVDPRYLDGAAFQGRAALLCPIDRLVFDRTRMGQIFDFDYVLEMYKPKAKRRWGYYALPVLDGDQLVGKVDATADRKAGVLRVDALHEDGEWSAARRDRVVAEIEDLARWQGLNPVLPAHLGGE